jgi:4-amino-4-deoxy-L-arabinose transferase-like glycosyltransferase
MLILQVLVSTLLIAATGLLGACLFNARIGLIAAVLAALDPVQIAYSRYLWSEPLFSLLVCSAVALAALSPSRPSGALELVKGVLLGFASLTREIAIPVTAIVVPWWAYLAGPEFRVRSLRHGAITVAVMASSFASSYSPIPMGRFPSCCRCQPPGFCTGSPRPSSSSC